MWVLWVLWFKINVVVLEFGNIEELVEIVNEFKVMMNENFFMVVMLFFCVIIIYSVFTVEFFIKLGGYFDQGEVIEVL